MRVDCEKLKIEYENLKELIPNNATLEEIKIQVRKLFASHGVNAQTYTRLQFSLDEGVATCSNKTIKDCADVLAQKIYREKIRKRQQENALNQEEFQKTIPHKKPRIAISFDIVKLGACSLDEIESYFRRMFLKAGFPSSKLDSPNPKFSILDFNDNSMDLNINPDAPLVEQFAETTKKLFAVMVNNTPLNVVRNMVPTELNQIRAEKTTTNLDLPGYENDVQTSSQDSSGKIDVSFGNIQNGQIGVDIDNSESPLTPEDEEEIELYGIEGINTHEEMENFRDSDEYKLLQSAYALSKEENN